MTFDAKNYSNGLMLMLYTQFSVCNTFTLILIKKITTSMLI